MRWQHCLDHADNIQKPAESPDCLLGVVMQLADSRLDETSVECARGCSLGGTRGWRRFRECNFFHLVSEREVHLFSLAIKAIYPMYMYRVPPFE